MLNQWEVYGLFGSVSVNDPVGKTHRLFVFWIIDDGDTRWLGVPSSHPNLSALLGVGKPVGWKSNISQLAHFTHTLCPSSATS